MDLPEAVDVLVQAATSKRLRLQRGQLRRAQIKAAMEAGEPVSGPRVDWLRATANGILAVLTEAAQAYNAANPDDMISSQDLCDALATVRGWVAEE